MTPTATHFDAFVRALHARLVCVRVLEHAGRGALAGCAAAALVLPLLAWRDQPSVSAAIALLMLGTTAGLGAGIARRPSRLAAAMEADRQLNLSDLLGTAAALDPATGRDPWGGAVMAIADDCCRRHTPSEVLLRRFGARAWGGIGLAAALVLTLAALTTTPADVRAGAWAGPGLSAAAVAAAQPAVPPPTPSRQTPHAAAPPIGGPPDSGNPDAGETASPVRPGAGDKPSESHADASAPGAGSDAGTGGGVGRAATPRPTPPAAAVSPAAPPSNPSASQSVAATAGGGGATTSRRPPDGNDAGSGSASSPARAPRTPPWRSADWPADARAARQAVDAGRVPDRYRDLVREYFNPE